LIPSTTRRNDEAIKGAIGDLIGKYTNADAFLHACADAAVFCKGSGGGAIEEQNGDAGDAAAAPNNGSTPWNIFVATNVSKLSAKLQREIIHSTNILPFIVEWCETADRRVAGVAYEDVTVLYDVRLGADVCPVKFSAASPSNNVFIRVPHKLNVPVTLTDPVIQTALEELKVFIEQTFWCNGHVVKCMQAAQALAKRGGNIDRCFIGINPGLSCAIYRPKMIIQSVLL